MAFCKNCGKELPENGVCDCQAESTAAETVTEVKEEIKETASEAVKAAAPNPVPEAAPASSATNDKKSLAIVAAAGVVALILLIIIFKSLFGGGYKKPVENYFKGIQNANQKKYASAFTEDLADDLEDMIDDDYDDDFEDFLDDDILDELEDDYGKNIKFKVKFGEKEELKNREIRSLEKLLDVDIKKGYELELEVTVKGKKDKDTLDYTAYVGKIKGEGWKLLSPPEETEDSVLDDAKDLLDTYGDLF